ncbi:MAG: mobile mystery protein B [Acidimicrobiales bacterium]
MSYEILPDGDGHTKLSEEDRKGLKPAYIATRGELYEAEQRNIASALLKASPGVPQLLDDSYLRRLHKSMFEDVWAWAGTYRRRETNLGIDPLEIAVSVKNLLEDTRVWVDESVFEADELAIQFHHRLVLIHPFPNGNGRHGRIAADFLIAAIGSAKFSWGSGLGLDTQALREAYLRALRLADQGEIAELVTFARS